MKVFIIFAVILTVVNTIDIFLYMYVATKHGPQHKHWPFSGFYCYFFPTKNH